MPRYLTVGLSLFLAACATAPAAPSFDPTSIQRSVVRIDMRSRDGAWTPLCTGLSTSKGLIVNQHCLDQMASAFRQSDEIQAVGADGGVAAITPSLAKSAEGPEWAQGDTGSAGLDFALVKVMVGQPLGEAETQLTPSVALGTRDRYAVVGFDGRLAACKLDAVCGSEITYHCNPATNQTWSGSTVWQLSRDGPRLIGVHKVGPNPLQGNAVAWTTVIGRIASLRPPENRDALLNTQDYRHIWRGACSKPTQPFSVREIGWLWGDSLLPDGPGRFWSITPQKAYLINANTGVMLREVATPLPALAMNGVRPLRDGSLVIFGLYSDIAIVAPSGTAKWIHTPFHSVRDALIVGEDLLLSGDLGVCAVAADTCELLTPPDGAMVRRRPPWTANALERSPDGRVLAVGFAPDGMSLGASCGWYEKIGSAWFEAGRCPLGAEAQAQQRFVSPVPWDGEMLVGASDGNIYALKLGARPRRVPIEGLPGLGFEDAIRGLALYDNRWLAIVASDGSMRLFEIRDIPVSALRYSQRYELVDRAIWLKDVVAGSGWIAMLGQSHQVQVVDIKSPSLAPTEAPVLRGQTAMP